MAFSDFMDNVKTRSQEVHITLAITSGKKSLHMGLLASTITMRQNADGYIYFDTMPEEIFTLNDYSWEGPRYKNVTTTQEKGKHKEKFYNKCYRVFASNNQIDGRILKCDGVRNPAKFAGTSDHCFIVNGDVTKETTDRFQKLDHDWYISLAKKRLADFGVEKCM